MNLPVFMIWRVWDTIPVLTATFLPWMALKAFGASALCAVLYGSGVCTILWLGPYSVNMASAGVLAFVHPMAWVEVVVAALIVWWFTARDQAYAS